MSAKDILTLIRERQGKFDAMSPEEQERYELERSMQRAPVLADDWQNFKKEFVEEYNGEKVQDTGMTHSEFLQYMKDSSREGDEFDSQKKLRAFLNGLD